MDCSHDGQCMFVKFVKKDFHDYCEENNLEPSNENLIRFLCSHNFIKKKTKLRYMIKKAFNIFYPQNGFHKTNTVYDLAALFDVHENTIWNVLKNYNFEFENSKGNDDIYIGMEKLSKLLDDEYFAS